MRRRPRSSRVYLIGAGLLAVAAAFTSLAARPDPRSPSVAAGPVVHVVRAALPIDRGDRVQAGQLELEPMPAAYAPPGALQDIDRAAGRVALAALAPGEVVTETRLARVREGPVASLVPRGFRAFAVPTSLPPNALIAGDHVDVLATYASDVPRTELVAGSVEVLAVLGGGAGPSGSGGLDLDAAAAGALDATTLILIVSPEQQQRLANARAFASLEVTIAPSE